MQKLLSVSGLLLVTIFALSHGQSTPKTVLSVQQCLEERQTKCHSACANKLPQNKSDSVQCFADLISEGKAEFKKCLSDAGILDSSPCFAFNHTHGKGFWSLKGERHGYFGARRGHNQTALRGGFGGRNVEHGSGHKFSQDNKRRIQRSVETNSNSSSSSNSTEEISSEEEAATKKPTFDKLKKHGNGKNHTDNGLHLGWAKHQARGGKGQKHGKGNNKHNCVARSLSNSNSTEEGYSEEKIATEKPATDKQKKQGNGKNRTTVKTAKHASGGKGKKQSQGGSKHNRVARSLSNSNSNSSSTESSSEEKPSPKRGIGQSKKHGGVQGGRRGDQKGHEGAEVREYHQCLSTCFKSEDVKPCDDGCPAATEQIAAAFTECKKQGLAKGAKGKMAAFKKCLHPEQPLQ